MHLGWVTFHWFLKNESSENKLLGLTYYILRTSILYRQQVVSNDIRNLDNISLTVNQMQQNYSYLYSVKICISKVEPFHVHLMRLPLLTSPLLPQTKTQKWKFLDCRQICLSCQQNGNWFSKCSTSGNCRKL